MQTIISNYYLIYPNITSLLIKLETEIKYKDALKGMNQREDKYSQLCGRIKQKELDYEHKIEELNLKLEQDKYINKLINDKTNASNNKQAPIRTKKK